MRAFAWGELVFPQAASSPASSKIHDTHGVVRSDEYASDRRTSTSSRTPVRRLDPLPCLE